MKKYYRFYIENFRGLSREIWLLSLVTFVNRAGAMVIPFLSLYLVEDKNFTKPEVGLIMSCFGIGSFVGTWIGGKLTDKIGFYKVILLSLILGGIGFFSLQFYDSLMAICIGVFFTIILVDGYRPAIFVACDAYSKPQNITRSITLIRLAINLGFSIGPLLGGLIIAHMGYSFIFWIDGITCIIAGFMLFFLLKPKKVTDDAKKQPEVKEGLPPLKNKLYLLLFFSMVLLSILFVQYFSLVPLYYREEYLLSEDIIGLLLFLNGFLIFVFEMPLVGWLDRKKISKSLATLIGTFFLALSFLVLNLHSWVGVLFLGMLLMTIGEMIQSPFSNALALAMAPKGRKGSYMGLYSMSFSIAHAVGHNSGMNLVYSKGYEFTWYLFFGILVLICILLYWLYRLLRKTQPEVD